MAYVQRKRNMEDGRTTERSRLVRLLAEEIKQDCNRRYDIGDEAVSIANQLRKVLQREGVQVTISTKRQGIYKNWIFVGEKQERQMDVLKKMVRRLAVNVDNESLYEEAMALVKTI